MKRKLGILFVICCICINLIGCVNNDEYKYSIGKDTVVVVGDGRFQILKGVVDYSLFDLKQDEMLLDGLSGYYDDGEKNYIHIIMKSM